MIVAAAIGLLDDVGVEGLSMRKLAGRLHVQAPTLYYHCPDTDRAPALARCAPSLY